MPATTLRGIRGGYTGGPESDDAPNTGVEVALLADLLRKLTQLPTGFHLHPKLQRGLTARREMADGRRFLDWASAEARVLATLVTEGVLVRLTGQDTARGTFNQRHAVFYDQQDGRPFMPLNHLAAQVPIEIHNSPLCETGALGFEYGYSLDCPDGLILWEAQFGDFVNAAQVVLDQFITSAEDKWRRLSGLVLLFPHGFEGMCPEHSSARLERLLTLAAQDNLQIVQPTTPAQHFHALRRQALRKWRKPLFILKPKRGTGQETPKLDSAKSPNNNEDRSSHRPVEAGSDGKTAQPLHPAPAAADGAEPQSSSTSPKPTPSSDREEEVVPMTMLRRTVVRPLVQAHQSMATLTTINELDMSAVQVLRRELGADFEKRYSVHIDRQNEIQFPCGFGRSLLRRTIMHQDVNNEKETAPADRRKI